MNTTTNSDVGMGTGMFDVIVIGAGPVGNNVADRVARGRLSVAIVEVSLPNAGQDGKPQLGECGRDLPSL